MRGHLNVFGFQKPLLKYAFPQRQNPSKIAFPLEGIEMGRTYAQ